MGQPVPHDVYLKLIKWNIVKQTGWTFEYIDSLSYGKLQEILQIEDGLTKANK